MEAGNRKWAVRVGNETGSWKREAKTGNEAWKPETGSEDRKRGLEAGNGKRRPETRLGSRKREVKIGNGK